jgi:hypothetical protein
LIMPARFGPGYFYVIVWISLCQNSRVLVLYMFEHPVDHGFHRCCQPSSVRPHKPDFSGAMRPAGPLEMISVHTVDGCEILHHQKDGWNMLKPYK